MVGLPFRLNPGLRCRCSTLLDLLGGSAGPAGIAWEEFRKRNSMNGLPILLLGILLFPLTVAQSGSAAERTLVLKEHLNQKWGRELVRYPFGAPSGQCEPKAVSLTSPRGPWRSSLPRWSFGPTEKP